MKLFGTKYRESKKMESFVRMMTFVRRKKTISMIREAVKKTVNPSPIGIKN